MGNYCKARFSHVLKRESIYTQQKQSRNENCVCVQYFSNHFFNYLTSVVQLGLVLNSEFSDWF